MKKRRNEESTNAEEMRGCRDSSSRQWVDNAWYVIDTAIVNMKGGLFSSRLPSEFACVYLILNINSLRYYG